MPKVFRQQVKSGVVLCSLGRVLFKAVLFPLALPAQNNQLRDSGGTFIIVVTGLLCERHSALTVGASEQ